MYKAFYLHKKPKQTKKYTQREKENNYLKNWRVVRYYIQKKYDLNIKELEMILYLYDMGLFTRKDLYDYGRICSWGNNVVTLLKDRGLITMWMKDPGRKKDLFHLTQKAKLICNHAYKKLNGEEIISENPYRNEIFKGTTKIDKAYKKLIKMMNSRHEEK